MNTVLLPDLSLWVDEEPLECETLLVFVDGSSMMLNSFVPSERHELHSSYVPAGRDTVVASHLLVAPEAAPEPSTSTLADRDLAHPSDRRHCLLQHLALLRDALELRTGGGVRVEVGDEALRIADRSASGRV
jgi:hypothetical protein